VQIRESKNIRWERFDRIEFPDKLWKLNRTSRGLSLGEDLNISAFDFEVLTHEGKTVPAMLGYATYDSEEERVIEKGVVDKDLTRTKQSKSRRKDLYQLNFDGERERVLQSFLKEMTKHKYKDNLNFFYNIRYDMSILLSLLPEKQMTELYDFNETEYKEYKIMIIPKKILFIKRLDVKRKYTTAFYDLAALTKQSLDNASKSWLGKRKMEYNTAEIFNDFDLFLKDYNSGKMQEYCKIDCVRTVELANAVRSHFNSINVPFSRPASPASLAKDYIKFNDLHYPNFKYKKLQRMCYATYYGGLFEFYKRGKFKNAKGYDVDSLYPSVMVDLPSLEDCNIYYNDKYDPESDWAVIKARVWLSKGKIMPFSMKTKISYTEEGKKKTADKIIRPRLQGQEVIMSKQLYEFITSDDYPHLEKVEIDYAYNIYEQEKCRRPFGYLQDLFNTRVDLIKKYGKSDKRQSVIKVMLNSPYGATAEVIETPDFEEKDGIKYLKGSKHKAGDLFRPFLAFHITELSRLKMYENIYKADIEENVIAVATDCIYIDEEGQEKFEKYGDITDKKELGTFSIDYQGDMLAIGNGIYFFEKEKEITIETTKYIADIKIMVPYSKKTTRGFNENKMPDLLHNNSYDDQNKITVTNNRPLGFREVLYFHSGNSELIGKFTDEVKELNINMDKSRIWEEEAENLSDLKTSIIHSKPLELQKIKKIKLTNGNNMYYNEEKEGKENKRRDLILDKDFEKIEKFKNAMILLDKDGQDFQKARHNMKDSQWITWNERKVLVFNEALVGGDIPAEWQGFELDQIPWVQGEDRKGMREIILYLLSEREKMIVDYLNVLKNELKEGENPQTIVNYDSQGFMNFERSPSMNPKWFVEPDSYYNWYSLKSSLTKKRVFGQIEKKNENSQLYQDLKFLAHKIMLEGDPVRNYPPDEEYQDLHRALQEMIDQIQEVPK